MNKFEKLSSEEERIGKEIVDCAYKVHSNLGPGLLEKIYEACFCYELRKKNLKFESQKSLPINYDGLIFDVGFRFDVLVEDKVICELKAVNEMNSVYKAQLLTHMKLSKMRLGFLINFNEPLIKDGIKRIIL